ncbi:uncharacterized protein EMH_0090190 [Eimeria mitis]|uniref:Uncharacterized protein n=1 Tax=Eimeria mitis TaxID=44415 RepID=U6KF21_9EIME|nr:uncharacterized protein EMH_0090190 [Eimeria mitis]CDJ36549.1 hypothetical protein EMH_0090190 [Eimeria mitis]
MQNGKQQTRDDCVTQLSDCVLGATEHLNAAASTSAESHCSSRTHGAPSPASAATAAADNGALAAGGPPSNPETTRRATQLRVWLSLASSRACRVRTSPKAMEEEEQQQQLHPPQQQQQHPQQQQQQQQQEELMRVLCVAYHLGKRVVV